jgi:glycosyltransferase involved in cell wall biosynthesis
VTLRVLAWPAYDDPEGNPYNTQLYSHLAELGVTTDEWWPDRLRTLRYHVLHLHWPDLELQERSLPRALRRVLKLITYVLIARARGIQVMWTAHNLRSHERWHPALEELMWWCFTRLVDGHISLTVRAQESLYERFPVLRRVPGFVIPHGHFTGFLPHPVERAEARRRMAISEDSVVLVFFGRVRAYKNVDLLVRAFRAVPDARLLLIVAGRPQPEDIGDRVRSVAAGDGRVRLRLEFVPVAEIPVLLAAADLVVLPYRDILNSGAAILTLSYGRPVLVPALGSMPDLQARIGSRYVRTYTGRLTPEILTQAVTALDPQSPLEAPDLSSLDWGRIAEQTLHAYRTLLER